MTVFEPGPGMGYFTPELARLVGPSGRVVAVDIQSKMLDRLKRRVAKVGLLPRIEARLASPDSFQIENLRGRVDFILAFAVVHEFPDASRFFAEAAEASKPRAKVLIAEPKGHVSLDRFEAELKAASEAGFRLAERPVIARSHAALLQKD
jgi:SAM-dependent methyltransferase